jgi:hypothetical protein
MDKKVYIHIHIPKTSGSFIKSLNAPKIYYPCRDLDSSIRCHYTLSFLKIHMPSIHSDKVGVFAVVRNPFSRIYSLWNYAHNLGNLHSQSVSILPIKFSKFVYNLCNDEYVGYYFLQSQMFFIRGYEDVNFQFFKMEEREKLKDFMVNTCGVTWSDKKVNETPGVKIYYRDAYTPEMVEMVKTKFKNEFETFGYSTEL